MTTERALLPFVRRCKLLVGWILFLWLMAVVPINSEGPFDARNYDSATGVELAFPVQAILLEPFLAPMHALQGEPVYRKALTSTLTWTVLGGTALQLKTGYR